MEVNMQVLEGAQLRVRVKLTNEAGEQLPPELFLVYAGAFCPGCAPAPFHAERTPEEWVLTMPPLKAGRVPWSWQVFAAEYATGVEWLLAAGEVNVMERYAGCSGCVDADEVDIVGVLDRTTMQVTVQLGESTAACVGALDRVEVLAAEAGAAAGRAEARAADAAASAAEAAAQVRAALEHAVAADDSAELAAGYAKAAADSAADAEDFATDAGEEAEAAGASAAAAAGSAKDAAARAADAATSSQVAAGAASDALEAREVAVRCAEMADARMVAAQDAAADAEDAREGADEAAARAAAGAAGAQADASAAAESARAAAESAAQLGDAALKSDDNTFSGAVTFTGTVNGVAGYMQSNMLADMLKGAKLTRADMLEFVPAGTTIWANYPVPRDDAYTGDMTQWKKLQKAYITLDVACTWGVKLWNNTGLTEVWYHVAGNPAINIWKVYGQANKVVFLAPDFKGDLGSSSRNSVSFNMDNNAKRVEELYVHAPQFQRDLSITGWGDYKTAPELKRIVVGANVFSSVSLPFISPNQVLKTAAGFPMATSINLSDNQLNKESSLPILNNLRVYDSATMSKIPTLTIGMHTDLQADDEVVAACELAATAVEDGGKGWQVSVQWNGTATASTFALRPAPKPPVYVKRAQDEQGDYEDAAGQRYAIDWGHSVVSPHGEPEALGYGLFASVEDALTEWGLELVNDLT